MMEELAAALLRRDELTINQARALVGSEPWPSPQGDMTSSEYDAWQGAKIRARLEAEHAEWLASRERQG